MLRWMALCLSLSLAAWATAAPVPKPVLDQKENERLWKSLQHGSSIEMTETVCRLLVHPESTVPFLGTKLRPLTMTKKQVERAIQKLDSEKEWEGAYEELSKLDPRLALSLEECWALAKTEDQKRRLAWVLHGEVIGGTEESHFELEPPKEKNGQWKLRWGFGTMGVSKDLAEIRMSRSRPKWFAETQAVTLLSLINSPAAWKVIEAMATGHQDARPTMRAGSALKCRKLGMFAPSYERPKFQGFRPVDPKQNERFVEPTPEEIQQVENRNHWNNLDYSVASDSKIESIFDFLLRKPDETVAFFKTKMWPLKLNRKRADELVAKLFGAKEADWKGAVAEFAKLDIRLAYTVQEAWELADSDDQRTKMAMAILLDGPKHSEDLANFDVQLRKVVPMPVFEKLSEKDQARLYFDFTMKSGLPKELAERLGNHRMYTVAPGHFDELNEHLWNRQACAIHILDAIGTADALELIRDMATGHPDAAPTKVAKEVLKRRKR